MKKTILLLLLVLTLSCSNDDSNDTQNIEIYMKVMSLGTNFTTEVPTYVLVYGTSETDKIMLEVTEKVYRFYTDRVNKNNWRWIGEVDHE